MLAVGALASCGDEGSGDRRELVVSAATSLKRAFTDYGEQLDWVDVRFSFAGSDELAAQIRQGVKPDLYAAANADLPDLLYEEGLVQRPVTFATNRLVLAVPAGEDAVRSLKDLTDASRTVAVGAPSVPVGAYTRAVLARLPATERRAILANVRSQEHDVAGIVGKLSQGAVDAGFVYVTDVVAAGGRLKPIELPDRLQPGAAYAAAVVKDARHTEAARAFVDGLLRGDGSAALRVAGFGSPEP